MNYGRYFRLNQALSKVVSGVAIYDYVDLPAYFGPSEQNPMSPKYPISVTITSDMVCFRLHYSAFKIEEKQNIDQILFNDGKKRRIENNFPQYAYDKDDINNKSLPKVGNSSLTDISMAHMEEVILELPYHDSISNKLSDTIKKIYNTTFPQVIDENTSMGGRFLEQLIKKRYPINKGEVTNNDIESQLYQELRKVSDETASYSTLWLMDLVRERRIYLYSKQIVIDDKTKKEKKIVVITGFLRKLLLDFMFDLKHSDVFQNSPYYQKMYSGLMSDFYFSALMHKCEYYYYRKLTSQAIKICEEENNTVKKRNKKKTIKFLYATELVKAEDLWIQDIMNPQAEKDFEHQYTGQHITAREFVELYSFEAWPSWFAEPEEEMRRVCFTMGDNSGIRHICNADTLVEHLKVGNDKDHISTTMVTIRNRNRELISRWFLKRYDFNDVIHLHLFKHLNLSLLIASVIYLLWLFEVKEIHLLFSGLGSIITPGLLFLGPFTFSIIIWKYVSEKRWAVKTRFHLIVKRTLSIVLFAGIPLVLLLLLEKHLNTIWTIILFVGLLCLLYYLIFKRFGFFPAIHPISCLHLLFPRLVAAITAAWLTMSMGFDIYVSFFDQLPSWYTTMVISMAIFGFIMYEINRIMPLASAIRKVYRSFEFLIISYCISLLVGLVVINFVGEKYLERGAYMEQYYDEYVYPNVSNDIDFSRILHAGKDKGKVAGLQYGMHKNQNHPIVEKVKILNSDHDMFIMRDFLIMFSFIAMFWGIFIQMIFTGEKQMTEL